MKRYIDDLGNPSIDQMSLKEVIDESIIRMNLLDRHHLQVRKESDLRVIHILGQAYTVFQYIFFEETEDTREYARAILVHLESQEVTALRFEAYYNEDSGEHYSHAHRFLSNLREYCVEHNLFTEREQQVFLDQQYR